MLFSNLFVKNVVQDLTSAGIDWQREKWQSGLGSKFIHQGEKNAAKYADEVIVLSKGVQDYFKETYGRETHFIPNGVNRPQIREASLITDKFGLKKDSYILFLGRLVPEKGIRYLVEAFKNVKTDKKLVIAGGSSDTDSFMEELKDLAKGDDRILFTGFVQGAMMRDAKDQKMDLIICASISRFARNFSDCMTQIAALKTMHPAHPIGVYFETENIYTLNPSSQYSLDIQALLADWESGNKSRRMILSYDQRIMTGQYPVADLMGYRHTKDGRLVIEPEEAKTVRFIFLAFIQGYNYDQIAAVLTQKKRSTLRGRQEWNGMMVANIMKNERRWGDLEARKSIVVDYKLGKVTKNNGNRCSAYVMQKKGMYLGGYRPFGFLSDPNDCHKLILDPVASRYVRLIFELALQGNRTGTIAKILNKNQIPTPAAYHVAENHVYSEQKAWDLQRSHWTSGTVYHVLKNEKYKGTYVGAKFIMPVPCKHRVLRAPLEQQVRIEDSHATIVTPEEFEQAQIQNRNFRLL